MKEFALLAALFAAAVAANAAEYDVVVDVNSCPVEAYGEVMAGKANRRAYSEKEFSGKVGENWTVVLAISKS